MSPDPIHSILTDFTAQIRAEIHRQAIAALGGGFEGAPRHAKLTAPPRGGKGAKRDPALLDKLQDQFLAFVKQNPGLRIEQINKQLGTTTKELALPIRKLVAAGQLKTHGSKRSTSYSSGGSNGHSNGNGVAKKTVAAKTVRRPAAKRKAGGKRKPSKPATASA